MQTSSVQPADCVIANGTLATETGLFPGDIAVQNGRIVGITAPGFAPPSARVIDATGRMVLPGCIDVHVHFRMPGMGHKEDWETGSQAAAVGGVTTVFDMPNTIPATATPEDLAAKAALAEAGSIVDFGLYGLLGEQNLDQMEGLAAAGAIGFKLFLGNTTGDLPCPSDGAVLEGFEILAGLGLRCSIHAENSPILFWRQRALQAAGRTDALAHLAARTDVVAVEALNRSATLAEWTGARIHIVHESCARSLPHIRWWKGRGVDITVETLPQYLTLSAEEMAQPGGEVLRMNPPIREAAHQGPLWEAICEGTIDMIATDHAPHAAEEKRADTIWQIACGFPGVETSLPLMLTAVNDGRLTLPDLVRLMAGAPARAFGLAGRKGSLSIGADADIVVVDMAATATLGAAALHSKGKVSAYEGRKVTGLPVMTLLRGEVVARDGQPVTSPSLGRQLRPEMPPPAPRNLATTLRVVTAAGQLPFGDPF
jgi:dihydroorotase